MPAAAHWTEEQDATIRSMRSGGASYDEIGATLGVSRWTAIERARKIGATSIDPAEAAEPADDDEYDRRRGALPPGHPQTWGLLTDGTCLEGEPYPYPTESR